MNAITTFFRHRERDPGATYQVNLRLPRYNYLFHVYARRPMESRALQDRELPDEKAYNTAFQDLYKDLGTHGNGGWIVTVVEDGVPHCIGVHAVSGMDTQPASGFAVLAPGRAPYFLAPASQGLDLPVGSHLVLPVDEHAEAQLQDLIGNLAWFPPDFESTFLNTLRRPSLDARLDRIENKLFGQTAAADLKEAGTKFLPHTWRMSRRWLLRPAVLWAGVAVALALLLAWNVLLLSRLAHGIDEIDVQIASLPGSPPPSLPDVGGGGAARPLAEVSALGRGAQELLARVRGKQTSDPVLDLLYKEHFASLAEGKSEAEVAKLFEPRPTGLKSTEPGNRPFLLGLIKLQALKLKPEPQDKEFLKAWDNITATKRVFQDEIGRQNLANDAEGLKMLSALACRLGYSTPVSPGLPDLSTDQRSSPAFEFSPGRRCEEFTAEDIENGMKQLIDFVKER